MAQRLEKAAALQALGIPSYPDADAFRPTTTSQVLLERYKDGTAESLGKLRGPDHTHRVTGRVVAIRSFGKAAFAVLRDREGEVQAYVKKDALGEAAFGVFEQVDVGDFLGVEGTPMRSKKGDFALAVTTLRPLAKTVRPPPGEKWHGLTDKETRYRQRYADLIANPDVAAPFKARARIVRGIRKFLDDRGFLEVETPMMHPIAGGAAARPFVTKHNALDMNLYMRIAPELYLKRLIVGGFDRVYEINRNFRNEGMSLQHNPEFTMLEFYGAYLTYHDLTDWTEELIVGLVQDLHGSATLDYHYDVKDRDKVHRIDFGRPWKRVTIHDAVAQAVGVPRGDLESLDGVVALHRKRFGKNEEKAGDLKRILSFHGADAGRVAAGHVVYALFEELVEPTLIQPTFVHQFPIAVSPLARRSDKDPTIADRFELFIAGREIANAFSELNDPRDQETRFRAQVEARKGGDEEAMPFDADYIRALEYGLPPAAGEGIGIDRLVMLLTDQASIRDVILFPLMRRI